MRSYLASLILGVAVGIVYVLVKVRSPAPPAIALFGLLGGRIARQITRIEKQYPTRGDLSRSQEGAAVSDDVRDTEGNERRF